MSLKAFHIFFISVSALLFFGIGLVRGIACLQDAAVAPCLQALAAVAAGAGLVVYGISFVRKTRSLSYL
jgi:hypothetical protein